MMKSESILFLIVFLLTKKSLLQNNKKRNPFTGIFHFFNCPPEDRFLEM